VRRFYSLSHLVKFFTLDDCRVLKQLTKFRLNTTNSEGQNQGYVPAARYVGMRDHFIERYIISLVTLMIRIRTILIDTDAGQISVSAIRLLYFSAEADLFTLYCEELQIY
jgi:hypothetical protein